MPHIDDGDGLEIGHYIGKKDILLIVLLVSYFLFFYFEKLKINILQ